MRHDRGYTLILSLLALLVLSGVGLFALRTSRTDLRAAGNIRLGSTADYVAETAMQQSFSLVLAAPALYVQYMESGGGTYTIPYANTVFGENNLSTFDAFGVGNNIIPNFATILSRPLDVSPASVSGYSVGSVGGAMARIRLKRIDMTSTSILNPAGAGSAVDNRTATSQVRSNILVGPL
jgi:hypothetical protein